MSDTHLRRSFAMLLFLLLGLAIGTVAGAFAAYFASRARSASLEAQLSAAQAQARELQGRLSEQQRALDTRNSELSSAKQALAACEAQREAALREVGQKAADLEKFGDELRGQRQRAELLNAQMAELRTCLEEQKKSYEQQMSNLREAEARLKDTFSAIAAEALKGNNQQFLDLAKSELERQQAAARNDLDSRKKEVEVLVRPIAENLDKLNREVQQIENKREHAYGDIKAQIEGLRVTGNEIKAEAARLVGALKMPQQRGRWGEIQLRRVVELAGMVRYCDFDEQVGVRDSEDNLLRPDMTVRLPGGRTIVVDSKVSLSAYLEAAACDDEIVRATRLKEHAAQVRTHLGNLAKKTYWNQFDCTPEFVVAFLPGEAFFSAALQQDPTLIEVGAEQRVVLATPTTLIALLKAVAYGWRQEDVARNAQQISALGRELYDRISKMYSHLSDLRRSLEGTVKRFNSLAGSFETRVLPGVRKFKELGATAADDIGEMEPIETAARDLAPPPTSMTFHALIAAESGD